MTTISRLQRAFEQRLYLIGISEDNRRYTIQGSQNRSYIVSLDLHSHHHCECPDHRLRGTMCKHICFVLLRVLRLEPGDPRLACLELSPNDIGVFTRGSSTPRTLPLSDRATTATVVEQKPVDGAACAICFEDMTTRDDSEPLVYCKLSCGQSVHADCQAIWSCSGEDNTCVYCRHVMDP